MENQRPVELREIHEAASLLVSLKAEKINSKTTDELISLINKFSAKPGANPNVEKRRSYKKVGVLSKLPELPQFELPLQSSNFPSVPHLEGLIAVCSKPFEKQLTASDVRDNLIRLTISSAIVETILRPMLIEGENLVSGIPVSVYDMEGKEYKMAFKFWADKINVLTGPGWKNFYKDHNLKAIKDFLTIWMFRHANTRKLCFVIASTRSDVNEMIKRRKIKYI